MGEALDIKLIAIVAGVLAVLGWFIWSTIAHARDFFARIVIWRDSRAMAERRDMENPPSQLLRVGRILALGLLITTLIAAFWIKVQGL